MRNCILVCWLVWLTPWSLPAQDSVGDSIMYYGHQGFPEKGLQWAYRNKQHLDTLRPASQAQIKLKIAWQLVLLNRPQEAIAWGNRAIGTYPTPATHAQFAVILAKIAWEIRDLTRVLHLTSNAKVAGNLTGDWLWIHRTLWVNATRRQVGIQDIDGQVSQWLADSQTPANWKLQLQAEILLGKLATLQADSLEKEVERLSQARKKHQGAVEPYIFALLVEHMALHDQNPFPKSQPVLSATDTFLNCQYYAGAGKIAPAMAIGYLHERQEWESENLILSRWERKARHFNDPITMADLMNRRGSMLFMQENMYAALAEHQAAKQTCTNELEGQSSHRRDSSLLASIYNNIGGAFGGMKQSDSCLKYLHLAVNIYSRISNLDELPTIYFNIGVNHFNENRYDSAYKYFALTEQYLTPNQNTDLRVEREVAMAIAMIRQGHLDQGRYHLQQLRKLCFAQDASAHIRYMEGWARAEMAIAQGNMPEALAQIASAKESEAQLPREKTLILLKLEVQAREAGNPENDDQFHQNILKVCEAAFSTTEAPQGSANVGFNLLMKMPSMDFFAQRGIEACLHFHQTTHNRIWLEKAFEFSEKARSRFLNYTIRDGRALVAAGVPQDTIQKKRDLEKWIAQQEAWATKQQSQPIGADSLHRLQDNLNQLKDWISTHYPAYLRLMEIPPYPSVDTLLQFVRHSQTAIIEYFQADHNLHIFLFSPDTFFVHSHPLPDSFPGWVDAYSRQATRKPSNNPPIANYAAASHPLYRHLIQPIQDFLPEKVAIIPHQSISRISFGTLLQPESNARKFLKSSYLIEKYQFSIHYSCQWLIATQMPVLGDKAWDYMGFAPMEYKGTSLESLPGALYGIQYMQNHFRKTQIFTHANSSSKNFLAHISQTRILDIATHTTLNTSNPLQTSLHMYGNEEVTLADLYMSNINAEMANLQACQTGIGKALDGEGFLSLAWGFANAGCRSILMSMWEVEDEVATPRIMKEFYEGLSEGKAKDEAITLAIRNFLSEIREEEAGHSGLGHPYYWGELVMVGDTQNIPLRKKIAYSWWIGSFSMAIGLLLAIWYFRMRSNEKRGARPKISA